MTLTNKAFINVEWPVPQVLAFSTTRHSPEQSNLSQTRVNSLRSSQRAPKLSSSVNVHVNIKPESPFDDFNLGLHVGDEAQHVLNNRNQLNKYLPAGTNIQWLEQVHSNFVQVVNTHSKHAVIADASYTREKNVALAIMTADCLPIFITNKKGDEIAAIHGGWRPLVSGVIGDTVSKFSSHNNDLYAWLGPCIGEKKFEIGEDVYQAFIALSVEFKQAFKLIANTQNKYLADLQLIATMQLKQLGVKNIFIEKQCTFLQPSHFYSYRRDGKTGRMASVISILK